MLNFAVMGFLGIALDFGTALFPAIVIGFGIDYIIHYQTATCDVGRKENRDVKPC